MSWVSRVDGFQRRHPLVSYPLAVVYKFYEDQGPYLAAIITYYGLLSLVPLLLLLSTVLGYVLAGNPGAQQAILESAATQIPVIRDEIGTPGSLGGGGTGLVIGIVGALYGALGIGLALQNAVNTAWGVPRNERPNPFASRLRSLLLIVTAGLFVVGTTVLNIVLADLIGAQGTLLQWMTRAGYTALAALGFTMAFRLAAAHRPPLRTVLPGAVLMGVLWQFLQRFGGNLVGLVSERSSVSNQVFTAVLGVIAFLFVSSCVAVLCVEVDVVRVRRLYPRALLTPFTDAVSLTEGDQRAYTRLAQAQRHKGFERVHVEFGASPLERRDDGADGGRGGGDDGRAAEAGGEEGADRDLERVVEDDR
ncbi:YihY/virulence factor BrkB family protein [Kineococcus sp. SYSU DK006]|uniref:YihY/virulence factor BrkB family protein n=1 Tax=Kineococcus sp. SYSU DK006 TaxID=3383127 RepID=UPI003D7F0714